MDYAKVEQIVELLRSCSSDELRVIVARTSNDCHTTSCKVSTMQSMHVAFTTARAAQPNDIRNNPVADNPVSK